MDRTVVDAFLTMPERNRFVRGMVAWTGFRQEAVLYRRAVRAVGDTQWPLQKMLHFATDAIVLFSLAPLRVATWLGLLATGVALVGVVSVPVICLFGDVWVSGWAALFIAILFPERGGAGRPLPGVSQ